LESALSKVLSSLLRPLIRHLIGQGVTFPAFCELVKSAYVAEAERHDREDSTKEVTDSRVSLLTGVHRKDVKRLRAALRAEREVPSQRGVHIAARVIATWVSTARYLDAGRRPRVLPLRAAGRRVSFESLVREAKADLRPKVVLDELQRVGVVEVTANDDVRLLRTAYVSALPAEKLEFLSANVGDHLRSALHNIGGGEPAFLERAVYYDAVPAEALASLRGRFFEQGDAFLRQINHQVMPLDDVPMGTGDQARCRMRLGVYYYEEESREAGSGEHHE
jgi:hypothetical protein